MFTGIVEEKGTIQAMTKQGASMALTIHASEVLADVKIGDSISVNGVCLTVIKFDEKGFTVDVMPETFRDTALSRLTIRSIVNLERAMAANGRFGGHFVSGHVDRVGIIERIWYESNAKYMLITVDPVDMRYLVEKGSITVDGTSLTVFDLTESGFIISLIPETQAATILGEKQQGDHVNLEFDMLAKYIDRLLNKREEPKNPVHLTEEKLQRYGFFS
ncbi:riboflavin synthase [Amphibacillus jilinensis]|uniref:riboflavin synthase n=1 Tax=Amphibacillus jilinensis TaxID=1216008 RepID=UPI00031E0CB3|nr:riboflavin synthase [Amphibacillus jilinensis]